MCGRFVLYGPDSRLVEAFDLRGGIALLPRYNIAPGSDIVVIRQDAHGHQAETLRWGLKRNGSVANLRDDSAAKSWAWPLLHARCVIPANGFYEWQAPDAPHARKQPFYLSPLGKPFFAIAAVVGQWEDSGVALFTTGPNTVMRPIHDRMPVLLDATGLRAWLDPHTPVRDAVRLLQPAPESALAAWPVSTQVNDAHHAGRQLIDPIGPDHAG